MKKYLSFFRIRFIAGLQYRAAAWAGVATQFAWGGLSILMYRAFYNSDASAFPMELSALSSYIWLQQSFLAMFMAWFFDSDILDSIQSGSIAYEMCRPCGIYSMWYIKNMAVRLSRMVLRCLPILIFAAILPTPYGIALPPSLSSVILFLISVILGFLVLVAFSMLIYISAFYTVSSVGVRILATSVAEFFSGAVIPLPFFPEGLRTFMNLLPFASMQSTPFLIYAGHISGAEAVNSILLQLVWLTVLLALGLFLMKHALKRVVVQGG